MSVLVTGATGFLGRASVECLIAHGETHVRCLVRASSDTSRLEELRLGYPNSKLEYVTGNLTSAADAHRALEGITTVYHLAAQMRGAAATVFLNTVVGSKRLLEAVARTHPRRVVLVSSLAVYGTAGIPAGKVLDENAALERRPEKRDVYSQAKLRQEMLFREHQERCGYELVVLRPGVLYGNGGKDFSPRVGVKIGGWLLHLGGDNLLPLTHVQNCAEAVVVAGKYGAANCTYNVIDDDLPSAAEYLAAYKRSVRDIHSVRLPFFVTMVLSRVLQRYSTYSRGQIPAALTPYKSATLWKGHRFDNQKIKSAGWRQTIATAQGLQTTFEYLRRRSAAGVPGRTPEFRSAFARDATFGGQLSSVEHGSGW